jgi:hypothetical protein
MNLKLSEKITAKVKSIDVYDESFFSELLKYTLIEVAKIADHYNTEENIRVGSIGFEHQINDLCKIVVDIDLCVSTKYSSDKLVYSNVHIKNLYTFLEDSSNCDEVELNVWSFDKKANDFFEISIEDELTDEIEGERV